MKQILVLIAIAVIGFGAPSCTNFPFVSPSTNVAVSSYTVQAAEKALKQFKLTVDLFAGLVKDNHAFVVAHLPKVYAFAQKVQAEAPSILQKADAAKNNFKHNRDATNQATLDGVMKTLIELEADVQDGITQIKAQTKS